MCTTLVDVSRVLLECEAAVLCAVLFLIVTQVLGDAHAERHIRGQYCVDAHTVVAQGTPRYTLSIDYLLTGAVQL